jgi:tetratricopeptide (TPR) repeat protein
VDKKLRENVQDLETLSNGLNTLLNDLNDARMNAQSAVASLRQDLDIALASYEQAAVTFKTLQGSVDAMVADAVFQKGHYEEAIRIALRAMAASPEILTSYETLIQVLLKLNNQTALSHDVLDASFQELVSVSDTLVAEGTIDSLKREHKAYLSRIYFEYAQCFAKAQGLKNARLAIMRAIEIAKLVGQNEANIARLQRWQETLNNR